MKRILAVSLVLMALIGLVASAQTLVMPRDYTVLLFDNDTGGPVSKLAITFDAEVVITPDNVIAFGGAAVGSVANSTTFVFISVLVERGGTLQVVLGPEYAGANVSFAYWFK